MRPSYKLGELLLGAIPTVIFVMLLFGIYKLLVHKPLTAVLAERRAGPRARWKRRGPTSRQRKRVPRSTSSACAKPAWRSSRPEARRQQALQTRAAAVAEARGRAQAK